MMTEHSIRKPKNDINSQQRDETYIFNFGAQLSSGRFSVRALWHYASA